MKCSICGGQISGREEICPTCGMRSTVASASVKPSDHVYVVPLRREKRRSPLPYLILVILVAAGFAAIFRGLKLRQSEISNQLISEVETFMETLPETLAESLAWENFSVSVDGTTVNMIFLEDTYLKVQSNDPDLAGEGAYSITITTYEFSGVSLEDVFYNLFNDFDIGNCIDYIDAFYGILTFNGNEYEYDVTISGSENRYYIVIYYEGYTFSGYLY